MIELLEPPAILEGIGYTGVRIGVDEGFIGLINL